MTTKMIRFQYKSEMLLNPVNINLSNYLPFPTAYNIYLPPTSLTIDRISSIALPLMPNISYNKLLNISYLIITLGEVIKLNKFHWKMLNDAEKTLTTFSQVNLSSGVGISLQIYQLPDYPTKLSLILLYSHIFNLT